MENSYSIIKNYIYFKQHTLFKKWILVKMAGNVHRGKKKSYNIEVAATLHTPTVATSTR